MNKNYVSVRVAEAMSRTLAEAVRETILAGEDYAEIALESARAKWDELALKQGLRAAGLY